MERVLITVDHALEEVRFHLERDRPQDAVAVLRRLRPADQAELLSRLEEDEQVRLLQLLTPEEAALILEELSDVEAADLAEALPRSVLGPIVREMSPDEAVDLLQEVEPEVAEEILPALEEDEVSPLLLHPEDTAGGLMTSTFLALRLRTPVGEALEAYRRWQPDEDFHYLFVVDAQGRLRGVVSLGQLVKADPSLPVSAVMDPDVLSVPVGTDQEECARLMSRYGLELLPVVDEEGRLVGVITAEDVMEVLEEEATEDIHRLGGAEPLEAPYLEAGILEMFRKRVGWLLLLFLGGTLTGTVMQLFEKELATVLSLSYFIPLVLGTGGNSGSQTTATVIRALALGEIRLRDALRVLWREVRVGLLLGASMAIIGYGRALLWGTSSQVAIAVGVALILVVLWAVAVGSLLPLFARLLRLDPAVVSGPMMSTLVDATGLFLYFSVAKWILGI